MLVAVYIAPFNCAGINRVTVLQFRLDYLVHVVMFAPLVVLWRLVFPRHSWWVVFGTGLGLAAGLEGLQCGMSYRSWNVNDMIANMIGILLGSGIALLKHARPDPASQGENMTQKNFALIGAAGYVAPRHMRPLRKREMC